MSDDFSFLGKRRAILLISLLLGLFVILWLSILVFRHFLVVLAVAASVAILLGPATARLTRWFRGNRTLAASVLLVLTILVILIPLFATATLVGNQAMTFLSWLQPHLTPEAIDKLWKETLPARYPWVAPIKASLQLDHERLTEMISPALSFLGSVVPRFLQQAVSSLAQMLFGLMLFLFILFFLLRDGHHLSQTLKDISPLDEKQEKEVSDHLYGTVKGVLLSMVLVPIAQGCLAMIGFAIFGLPTPFFWGGMLILAAVIPGIGSPLVWVPAGIYLILAGSRAQGIGLLIYGILVISAIDNFLKPVILGGSARIHPLLGFLSILGGMLTFGLVGFLIGPVILSLLLSAVRIYRAHLANGLLPGMQ